MEKAAETFEKLLRLGPLRPLHSFNFICPDCTKATTTVNRQYRAGQ